MNHPKDKIIKVKTNFKSYDLFELYFGFKGDTLNTYGKKRKKRCRKKIKDKNH
tara:strand:+ start:6577 stop:6735 length:159 start_codon:yes stop_codon:yes gene_type:complete